MRPRYLLAGLLAALLAIGLWQGRKLLSPHVSPPAEVPAVAVPVPADSVAAPQPAARVIPSPAPVTAPPKPVVMKKTSVPPPPHTAPAQPKKVVPVLPVRPAPPKPVPPPALAPQEWKGNSGSAITHPGQIVIQNESQWNHFWAEHHPHEVSPDVDFSRSMVVGIFLGQRPADGFDVEITGVRAQPDALVVDYAERAPPPGTFQIGMEAFPYHIKVIPRSTQRVKFNKLTSQYLPDTSIIRSTGTPAGK